jgi:hypothetical protein
MVRTFAAAGIRSGRLCAVAVDVTTQLVVAVPVGAVAGYAADPSNGPSWYKNIASVD